MEQLFITGLLYYEEPRPTLADTLYLVKEPLAHLPEEKLRPSKQALADLMAEYM